MAKKVLTGEEIRTDAYLNSIREAIYSLRQNSAIKLDRAAVKERILRILEKAHIEKDRPYKAEYKSNFLQTIFDAIENYVYLGWPTPRHILTSINEDRAEGTENKQEDAGNGKGH